MPTGLYKRTITWKWSPESRKKGSDAQKKRFQNNSIWNKGKRASEEARKRMKISNKLAWSSGKNLGNTGKKIHSEESRKRMSELRKGKFSLSLQKAREVNMRNYLLYGGNRKNCKHAEESKKRMSLAKKKAWQNPEFAQKMFKARGHKPTKPEIYLTNFLNINFPNEWKYTGDGQVWIAGKNPDFINCNGKKLIIEYNETYWHKDEQKSLEREALFKQYGFSTLFLNENDLKNIHFLKRKIREFNEVV